MSPRSVRNLVRALLVPVSGLLTVSLATASPVEAASPPPATPDVSSPPRTAAAAALSGRVSLGTVESAHLQQRLGATAESAYPLVYGGGQVQNTPQVYLSLWGSDWKGAAYQSTISYLQGFFGNVGGTPWLGVTTQYYSVGSSNTSTPCGGTSRCPITNPVGQLKATWIDNHDVTYATPAQNCGSNRRGDCDVMAAAQRAAAHFGPLPRGAVIMVFTPSGRSQPGFVSDSWCAYHSASSSSGVVYGYIPYLPDAGYSCGANSVNQGGVFDGFGIVGGHEYAEAITDPYPDSGWTDTSGHHYENGDKCAWTHGLTDINLGGRLYAVQPTWSVAANDCRFGLGSQQVLSSPPQLAAARFSSLLGGALTSAPAATSWGPGRLDVVARGSNNALVHRSSSGGAWSGWETVGGALSSAPAVVSWSPGRLDVFVRGSDNALWHTFSDGSRWYGWERLGGSLKANTSPAVASWGPGRLDIFVTGTDNAVWHKWYGGGWGGWESQGGNTSSSPAAVSAGSGVVDIFTQGSDNALRHKGYNGAAWSGWDNLGGVLAGAPTVAATGIDQMAVFVLRNDGLLYRNNWNGGAWSGFMSLGPNLGTAVPSATVQPDTLTIDLFTQGNDAALWHATSPVVI